MNVVDNVYIQVINITAFQCLTKPSDHHFESYDLRDKRELLQPIRMNLMTPNEPPKQYKMQTVSRPNTTNKQIKIKMGGLF